MYGLLIVDDEEIVRRSISHIVQKRCSNIEVVGTADNGADAITLAAEEKPDIILMDIELYGINGLEAVREIKKILPEAVIIIISAYDKFQYARLSIELGVMEYLLKPVSRKDILDVLQRAVDKLDEIRRSRRDELRLREKLQELMPLLEEDFFFSLLYPGVVDRTPAEHKRLLNFDATYGRAVAICTVDGNCLRQKREECRRLIAKIFRQQRCCLLSPVIGNMLVALVGFDEADAGCNEQVWEEIWEALEKELDTVIALFLGRTRRGFDGLIASYREVRQLAYLSTGLRGVYSRDNLPRGDHRRLGEVPWRQEKELFEAVEAGEEETAALALQNLYDTVAREANLVGLKNYFDTIVAVLLRFLYDLIPEEELRSLDAAVYRQRLKQAATDSELRLLLMDIVASLVHSVRTAATQEHHPVIKAAKDYIDAHFHTDISVADIADAVGISPSYLSKLFKDAFQQTVMSYVTNRRIEKALMLLRTTDLSIKEVAYKVGYNDPNYFSKVFRKITHMSPTSIRK